jgi:hypothetical protein
MMLPDGMIDNIDEMIRLSHEKIETLVKLKKGLLLADLLGVPPKDIKEPLRVGVIEGGSVFKPWVGAVLRVRIGDRPAQEFPLKDVDRCLWPEDMQQAWGRWQKQQEKMRNRTVADISAVAGMIEGDN